MGENTGHQPAVWSLPRAEGYLVHTIVQLLLGDMADPKHKGSILRRTHDWSLSCPKPTSWFFFCSPFSRRAALHKDKPVTKSFPPILITKMTSNVIEPWLYASPRVNHFRCTYCTLFLSGTLLWHIVKKWKIIFDIFLSCSLVSSQQCALLSKASTAHEPPELLLLSLNFLNTSMCKVLF